MISQKNKITQGQFALFIIQSQIGISILPLPFRLHPIAKGGGWISVLIAGAAVQIILVVIWALMKRFPSSTVYEISSQLMGRFLGKVIALAYIVYFLVLGGTAMLTFSNIISQWMLPQTPKWAVLALEVIIGFYLSRESLRTIARYFVLVCFLIPLLILLVAYGYTNVDFTFIHPLQEAGWWNILKGAKETVTAFYGFEILLIIYPFVEGQSGGKLKALFFANGFVTLFYTFTVFTCLITFNPEQFEMIPEPVLYLIKSYRFHIVNRPDLIFLSIWLPIITTSVSIYYYAAAKGIQYLFRSDNHKKAVPYAALICFAVALIPQTPSDVELLGKVVDKAAYGFVGGGPLLLLLLSYILKKKERELS
ncbi:GerAB/ArcD/ProY family transporter [Ectobacillus panaciterrae]|uniref:GerAB/ArcD/ProY family transporter n=1 Tax=Ectobacillus panaciterrae TaxID=363872 RepID=UPI000427F2AE|nr:GerAB/ArcD/ProY family transporter [Ectobacillus panaciterrae]